jgi:hypothetical protein
MTRKQITFLLAGFISGSITVVVGRVSIWVLVVGVGPIFFIALLAAIALTGSWPRLGVGIWRYLLAACISTAAYFAAFLTFWGLGGYFQTLLGARGSNDLSDFGVDIWIGLIAAALVAALCIELMAYVLTARWSSTVLLQLAGAGIAVIMLTFLAMCTVRPARNVPSLLYYWAFFGVLFSLGEALFCGLVGTQIQQTSS